MNARGEELDTTFLSVENATARGFIHRDYIAHCLRWSHVVKRLAQNSNYKQARLLDVGCGRELPLAKALYSSRLIVQQYWGVDAGEVEDEAMRVFHTGKFPLKVWENTDVCDITPDDINTYRDTQKMSMFPNWVTCFEVLEHVEPLHMIRMLRHVKSLMDSDGTAFFSTPCWNVTDCAANHVNEMRYDALGAIFERDGWTVRNVWGTFASIRDYQDKLGSASSEPLMSGERNLSLYTVFNKLREYYDSNFLSCVFAPLFPAQSRNCLWEVVPIPTPLERRKYPLLDQVPRPWGSSAKWEEMAA